jgi:Protein of unknown function (DUF3089)
VHGRRPALLIAALAIALTCVLTSAASAKTVWLCKPGLKSNPCAPSLSTTVFSSWNAKGKVTHPKRVKKPKIDCFYVYPTVSDQKGPNATKRIDPEERSIALYQASRYSQDCRVFAPMYRQLTVPAIQSTVTRKQGLLAYGDVKAAWKDYLRKYNKGRGVVVIGHSQGAFHLQVLVRNEIEKKKAVRKRLLSAILLGGNVSVVKGKSVGGSFKKVKACRSKSQLACVMAFSTYAEQPPADTLFGRVSGRFASAFGLPSGKNLEVLCTNPAALGGGSAKLDTIIPSKPFAPGTLIAAGIQIADVKLPPASTTYIQSRGAFTGRCSKAGGANVLRVAAHNGAPTPKPSPDKTWGLHLFDANVAQGDLLKVIRAEARAYAKRK